MAKTSKFRSVLRYPGGKTRFCDDLDCFMPNAEDYTEYREPMVGGGAFYFYRRNRDKHVKQWYLSDIYDALICYYWMVQNPTNCAQLQEAARDIAAKYPTAEDRRHWFEQNRDFAKSTSEFFKALYFFVYNRITFSGTIESGGFSPNASMKRFTESSIERLGTMPEALKGVSIRCEDYSFALTDPPQVNGGKVFVYLDPPYYTVDGIYAHNEFDHPRLADYLKECKHKFMLSYDDCPEVRELYKWAEIRTTHERAYGMSNGKRASELIITNY